MLTLEIELLTGLYRAGYRMAVAQSGLRIQNDFLGVGAGLG